MKLNRFIETQRWVFAKTYADFCPHEYVTLESVENKKSFYDFVLYIREHGFEAVYGTRNGLYFVVGEYYYWTMGAPISETTIINRAKLSDWDFVKYDDGKVVILLKNRP
jgi:hypothetical protein